MPKLRGRIDRQQFPAGHDGQVLVLDTASPHGIAWRSGIDRLITEPALRRPLGAHEFTDLTFAPSGNGQYRSNETVDHGRWTMRLHIEADGHKWAEESEL